MKPLWLILMILGGEGHKGGLMDIDPGLMFWTAVTFFLVLLVLGRYTWKPIIKTLQEREEKIKNSLDQADRARRESEALMEKNNAILARAELEAQQIMKKAQESAERLKAEIFKEATAKAAEFRNAAIQEIEREKTAALIALQKEVADIAVTAAGKIINAALNPEQHKKIVDDFISSLPNQKN